MFRVLPIRFGFIIFIIFFGIYFSFADFKFHWTFTTGICEEYTMLVSLTPEIFRCMTCGTDLEQHVNGKISYIPHITRPQNADPFVKEWKDG